MSKCNPYEVNVYVGKDLSRIHVDKVRVATQLTHALMERDASKAPCLWAEADLFAIQEKRDHIRQNIKSICMFEC